jgi:AraC-like DNA-binding protein
VSFLVDVDLDYIASSVANLSGIPTRVYLDGQPVRLYSMAALPVDPIALHRDEIFAVKAHVGYFITPHFNYYGVINFPGGRLVVGPSRQVPHGEQELRELAFRLSVPKEQTDAFNQGMQSIVRMPLMSMMQMMCTINYILNDEKLSLTDITIYESQQQALKRRRARSDTETDSTAGQPQHSPLHVEETLRSIIRTGDTETLQRWLRAAPAVRAGTVAPDQLRQVKNIFVVTATIASRAAIEGGMLAEDALSLSDAYIQEAELLGDIGRITNLQYHMIREYTEAVERLRKGTGGSRLAIAVANYVKHHLSEPITAEAIAKELYMGRSYFSTKFKAEAGLSVTDFVLIQKVEEARRLLNYTDKSISEIASYLGFSSQSHFTRVFRNYTGQTPKEFRK